MKFGLNFGLACKAYNPVPGQIDIMSWKNELSEPWVDEHGEKWYIG